MPEPAPTQVSPDLLPRLGAFARLLHDAGMEAGPRRLTDATRALNHIELRQQLDFRNALRAVFVSRKDDLATFEAAFDIFWAPADPRASGGQVPGRSRALPMAPERAKAWSNALGLNQSQMNREQDVTIVPASSSGYSAEELLRHKDFEQMTWQEMQQVRKLLEQAPWRVAETLDWARSLAALGATRIDASIVDATLGAALKYQEDLEKVREQVPVMVEKARGA